MAIEITTATNAQRNGIRNSLIPTTNLVSGVDAVVGGGQNNSATNSYTTVGGGSQNSASSSYATVWGGYSNDASGGRATVGGGDNNDASGTKSTVGGGENNAASSDYATVGGGLSGLADRYGMFAHASGRFSAQGDAQAVEFVMRNKTTNNTATQLFLDGSSSKLTIPSGKILACTINISGIRSTGATGAHYIRKVMIKNVDGTTSLVGAESTIGEDVEDVAGYDVSVTANDTDDSLDIAVTGATSEIIRWTAVVQGLEIAYGT